MLTHIVLFDGGKIQYGDASNPDVTYSQKIYVTYTDMKGQTYEEATQLSQVINGDCFFSYAIKFAMVEGCVFNFQCMRH